MERDIKVNQEKLSSLSFIDLRSLSELLWNFLLPFEAMKVDDEIDRRVKEIFPDFDKNTKMR